MSTPGVIYDRFAYGGRVVHAVWRPGPWQPPLAHITQASGICLIATGEVVLVSQDGVRWALPGGHLEAGESLVETLRREVHEEACATVTQYAYLGCQEIHETAGTQALPVYYQARFAARVTLDDFAPVHETRWRCTVAPEAVAAKLGWHSTAILAQLLALASRAAATWGREEQR